MNRIGLSTQLISRVAWFALGVLVLTTVHHVYGAYLYHTPWRLHVGFVSGFAAAVIVGSLLISRRAPDTIVSTIAFWTFVSVTLVVPVVLIGLFEGGYNHVLKNGLYFGGAPPSLLNSLFPPPTYEKPGNLFFEMSGIMQLVPALVTGRLLYRLVRLRLTSPSLSPASAASGQKGTRTLKVGDVVPQRALRDVRGQAVSIPDRQHLLHLQFRRFAGCPVCNLHLRSFVRGYNELARTDIREVVVFHSTAEDLRPHTTQLPFAVIADPGKHLYREFGVESSLRALLDPRVWPAVVRGLARSVVAIFRGNEPPPSVRPRGGRFGLPADFLIAPDGRVVARKYGCHASDQWSVEEVTALARDAIAARGSLSSQSTDGHDGKRIERDTTEQPA